ncbi:hypothetical protein [Empedobacter tilapiae]|uniref:Uncharacterized protein n=1 Tax=Empedobacter tilapiae TaxID=2491114 RepID=A0A4Z1BR04_9FLAO|nr:hypothetical protein [Empedobacter tilapiae]TGN29874.1 hypothetical protein E4J94_04065 [Empedobacter tilapiae]
MKTIHVNVKQLGKKYPILAEQPINIDTEEDTISIQELLHFIVQQQVENYNQKSIEKEDEDVQKLPKENYLPLLIESGKASFSSIYNENKVNLIKAQETASQAFEDGMFAIFLGDQQFEDLAEEVSLTTNQSFTFIRLTFLVGSYW